MACTAALTPHDAAHPAPTTLGAGAGTGATATSTVWFKATCTGKEGKCVGKVTVTLSWVNSKGKQQTESKATTSDGTWQKADGMGTEVPAGHKVTISVDLVCKTPVQSTLLPGAIENYEPVQITVT